MTSPSLFRAAPVQSYYNTQQLPQSPHSAARQSPHTPCHMLTSQIIMCHTSASKPMDLGDQGLIEHPHCPKLESSILKEPISKNKPNFPYGNELRRKGEFKLYQYNT